MPMARSGRQRSTNRRDWRGRTFQSRPVKSEWRQAPITTSERPKKPPSRRARAFFIFLLTSTVVQEQNPPSVTMRDRGHQYAPNELVCEVSSCASRGNVLSRARRRPDVLLHL